MRHERSDIDFPLWRKKVDAAVFKQAYTPIPKFLWKVWEIETLFSLCRSKDNVDGHVRIMYENREFKGRILYSPSKTIYRLFFPKELGNALKDVFVMSYMRSIEQDLRKGKTQYDSQDIEQEIPFWEFLDIEFDASMKTFWFKCHYKQKPIYIELFQELIKSHTLQKIDDSLNDKEAFRFVKGNWRGREELPSQIEAVNVIYNLIDTQSKKIYIGEAESLIRRIRQNREEIEDWDFYRFDTLPAGLTKQQRVAIERLIIRIFASFFDNVKNVPSMKVSDYILANKRIDT
ncbi:GIY-YIG nuclease family protein [Hymenobacter negativus]|uniref:GIY-YIG nuclease family protein n=1 Tax=Hymenobacter negativus TaxID=2795026 RepID=A0ABS0QCJ2_9BACT|nr:hypothetical protein [Hymenobacter negativus]MBH8560399.1 hypothetical protein [Hymenobacter negativus]